MRIPLLPLLTLCIGLFPGALLAQTGQVKTNAEKSADDPTRVTTRVGIAWSDNYAMDDSNLAFSGSLALDQARKINVRINSDASEWRVGGSWLFPIGIFNFNFGKNEYPGDASQTNYSIGTFVPLSFFGIEPAGFQIFPMAGYSYNTGDRMACNADKHKACSQSDFSGMPSPENGFESTNISGSSGYLGAFVLKPLTQNLRMIGFLGGSYGSKSDAGDNYKGYFGGLGLGYNLTEHNAVKVLTYVQDNNTYLDEADKRILLAWQYQL
ncbi:hypothetical protein RTE01_36470 [Raoultella terrigena]|jgi:hypothetical protein|uniref:Uncharacterized protein n=1 Tax=Raoultella terrigena TaxID=577 RepID=A0A485CJ15_RAOTE|nr:hypothetical protein [Raoultella terrigena]GEC69012.1 hypothetical protein RTE01_36470 [Raoultella terrigena]VFS84722.1 Uncharacterised protein [Raoultella terrigena]VUD31683.1 Uncharacterised protein [Raoultella sp. NCTC 9187]